MLLCVCVCVCVSECAWVFEYQAGCLTPEQSLDYVCKAHNI